MLESQYVTNIIYELSQIGAKAIKFVENEYTEKGTPDIIGSYKGMCFVIEAKIAPNNTSKIQDQRLLEWYKSGALSIVAIYPKDTPKDILKIIEYNYALRKARKYRKPVETSETWPSLSQFP